MIDEIKQTIETHLVGSQVFIENPSQDNQHFEAIVIYEGFETLPLVKQHQLVMNCLKKHFETNLHALKLKTLTPKQFDLLNPKV